MEKKTKLTISGSPKKSFKNFGVEKTHGKKTVVIGKNSEKPSGKGNFNRSFGNKKSINNFQNNSGFKSNFQNKTSFSVTDFEKLRKGVLFQKKGLQLFENAMLKKLEENKKTNFFLSTDCSAIKKYFLDHNKLKNYIKYYPRCSSHGNSRSNKEGIQEDLIDLYLLSKNKSIIGSHNSTFTEVAWWLAECPEDITIIYAGK